MSDQELSQRLYARLSQIYSMLQDDKKMIEWIDGGDYYGAWHCILCGGGVEETRTFNPTRLDVKHEPGCLVPQARYWRDVESKLLDPNKERVNHE